MPARRRIAETLIAGLALLILRAPSRAGQRLRVEVQPRFGDQALALDTVALETPVGQLISLSRCDLLLSSARLQRESGEWIGADTWTSFLSLRSENPSFDLENVPGGIYSRLQFAVGLPPALNQSNPAQYAAGHPLNPTTNGLHWGWQGGYIFAAFEGRWRDAQGALRAYAYHLANDENVCVIEIPVRLHLTDDQTMQLQLDLRQVFSGITLSEDTATTHSRAGDMRASAIRENLSHAFRLQRVLMTSAAPEARRKVAALIGPHATPFHLTVPAVFPRPALPLDNPLTNEGVALGERLFHDPGLSGSGTQSCASCHTRAWAFGDSRRFSVGAGGKTGSRRAMPLFNLAWKSAYFWDGRASSLRAQAIDVLQNPGEMHANLAQVTARLNERRDYAPLFSKAFGAAECSPDRIARALEQFLLTLCSGNAKFDRAMRGEDEFTAEEARGLALFNTEVDPVHGRRGADCFHCHGGPLFQSAAFANNGLDLQSSDLGRAGVTHLASDRGKFAVPSLRNTALASHYMHDGRFATLEEVIEHYNHGVASSETLDPNLAKHPPDGLHLSMVDKQALIAFLRTLTDREFTGTR